MAYSLTGNSTSLRELSGLSKDVGNTLWGSYKSDVMPTMAAARSAASYRPDVVNRAGLAAQQATDQATGALSRNLSRMGVNPNSGRFAGLMQEASLQGAAAKAGAMTRAIGQEREGEFSRLAQAAQLGASYPGTSLEAWGRTAQLEQAQKAENMAKSSLRSSRSEGTDYKAMFEEMQKQKRMADVERKRADLNAKAKVANDIMRAKMMLRTPTRTVWR